MRGRNTGKEGVVAHLENGQVVKVKEDWWQKAQQHKYQQWFSDEQRQAEQVRRRKKEIRRDIQEWRAIVKGWGGSESPAKLLKWVAGERIEVFYARESGKRGAIVVSYSSRDAKQKAMARVASSATNISMHDAYSGRASSNAWHTVRTWYNK